MKEQFKPIQLPVKYSKSGSQLVDAEGCAWLDVDALDYDDRDICVAMVKQIADALNATAREARLVEALEHYEDPAHWSQIRNNNGNGEFLPVRYSDGNNPNAHGRDVAATALNENIVRCSHGFDVLNDAGETIGHFDTAAEALAEYRGDK